ncbi:MAG: glycosyltransferase [Eubacteriales bacterium]
MATAKKAPATKTTKSTTTKTATKSSTAKPKFNYDLSICMIGKNEEAVLEKCFQTMQPLRDQTNSELIFTDTGSTDRTIEIAKKYADTFLEFEWCNDFSAARNYGLEHATGRWMVYFDCDYFFDESIQEFVDFINLPAKIRDEYDFSYLNILNYQEEGVCPPKDVVQVNPLIHNMTKLALDGKPKRFEGLIHETIPVNATKFFHCQIYVHHTGYAGELGKGKVERNRSYLERELEADPNNPKILCYNVVTCHDHAKRKEIALDALSRISHDEYHRHRILNYLMISHIALREDEEAAAIYFEYAKDFPNPTLPLLDLTYIYQEYFALKSFADVVPQCHAYLDIYDYLEKYPDINFASSSIFRFNNYHSQAKVCSQLCTHYLEPESRDTQKVKELLDRSFAPRAFAKNGLPTLAPFQFELASMCDYNEYIAKFCEIATSTSPTPEVSLYLLNVLNQHLGKGYNNAEILSHLSKNSPSLLTAMVLFQTNGLDFGKCPAYVKETLANYEHLHNGKIFADVFYSALIYQNDPLSFWTCHLTHLVGCINHLASSHADFGERVSTIISGYLSIDGLKQATVYAHLAKAGAVKLYESIVAEEKMENPNLVSLQNKRTQICTLFEFYISQQAQFLSNSYSTEFFRGDFRTMLTPQDLFVLTVAANLKAENPVELIRSMKNGLGYCPDFAPIVALYTKELVADF